MVNVYVVAVVMVVVVAITVVGDGGSDVIMFVIDARIRSHPNRLGLLTWDVLMARFEWPCSARMPIVNYMNGFAGQARQTHRSVMVEVGQNMGGGRLLK